MGGSESSAEWNVCIVGFDMPSVDVRCLREACFAIGWDRHELSRSNRLNDSDVGR